MLRISIVCALALSMFFAGCVGGDAKPAEAEGAEAAPEAAPEVSFEEGSGGIAGIVTDDSLVPLSGALVGLAETQASATTDPQGRFVFNDLAPGSYNVQAAMLGYSALTKRVDVVAGAATEANLVLVPIEVEEAYHTSQNGVGRFGCGFALKNPPVPPVVGARPALAACAATYGTPLSATDQFRVDFKLQGSNVSRVKSLVMESEWQSTQAMSGGFSMYWQILQDWGAGTVTTETARQIGSAEGGSPLKAVATDEVFSDGFADDWKGGTGLPKYCIENGECSIFARAFPYANTLGPSSPVDASVYADQPFTHWVTEFYGEYAPDDFTALADA